MINAGRCTWYPPRVTALAPSRAPSRSVSLVVLLVIVAAVLVGVAFQACADGRSLSLAVTNTSRELIVEVRIGGDRRLILAPRTTEYLPLPAAAWAWPRRIEAYHYPNGPRLFFWRADLNDLADNHWRLRVP